MPEHLLSIGMFIFGVPRTAYQELERSASWRWADTERFGARPASQFLGAGDETITLNGVLVPEIAGSFGDIERLREMAAAGEVYPVVLGTGEIIGDFRIERIDDRWRNIISGGLPRVVDFVVDLKRVDDAT